MPHNELFLGGLSKDARRQDLEEVFGRYGKITRCDIKYVNGYAGTAYGFVGFEDERDAEDALKYENGKKICGQPIIIEFSKSKPWDKSTKVGRSGGSSSSSSRYDRSDYGYKRHRSRSRSRSRSARSRSRSRRRSKRHHRSVSRSRSHSRSRTKRSSPTKFSRRDKSKSRSRSKSRDRRSNKEKIREETSKERDTALDAEVKAESEATNGNSAAAEPPTNGTKAEAVDTNDDLNEMSSANNIYVNDSIQNKSTNEEEPATTNGDEYEVDDEEEIEDRQEAEPENGLGYDEKDEPINGDHDEMDEENVVDEEENTNHEEENNDDATPEEADEQ